MTEFIYLIDSYKKTLTTRMVSCEKKGDHWEIVLDKTIFYPKGGGQSSDRGNIVGPNGKAQIKHVRMHEENIIHEALIGGRLSPFDEVNCDIDWDWRYLNMRRHSAGHIVHEATILVAPYLEPQKAEHGAKAFIEYKGSLPIDKARQIEQKANEIVETNLALTTELVTLEELKARASYVPEHLPSNKPLRILTIESFQPIPDGGTQVKTTNEVGLITISKIINSDGSVRVYYAIDETVVAKIKEFETDTTISAAQYTGSLLEAQQQAKRLLLTSDLSLEELQIQLLGTKSEFARLAKDIRTVPSNQRQQAGIVLNQIKQEIESALAAKAVSHTATPDWFDPTVPGLTPPAGHLHIVTQAIMEITRIFERIGFTRVRHPEVDWDYYAFESLNMPTNHPARDEWETFFIDYPGKPATRPGLERERKNQIVLTPHTSNGQVREMEKGKLPIRMINIAKCYRRQSDVSHVPMFHQFEGMYIDKHVSIGDLKGVFDFFVKQFFGQERKTRLRPFHFQFTEPSVEIDINCGICLGTMRLPNGDPCRLCKSGWLEMAGGGMINPVVLKNGGIDATVYSGFAFGWGVERAYMMKSGTKLDDIRLLYSNDTRFLKQF